jgi:hypothetical protein
MDASEIRRLLAIPALALTLAASEQPLSAISCSGPSTGHDCGHLFRAGTWDYVGCTNDPYGDWGAWTSRFGQARLARRTSQSGWGAVVPSHSR